MNTDSFWNYIRAREGIRLARAAGAPFPWTEDEILSKYKFTNVRRLHDKTTQWFLGVLKKNLDRPAAEVLYNCGIFRYHGTKEFFLHLGWQDEHCPLYMESVARAMIDAGEQVYTGAYIITNGGRHGFKETVVAGFLGELWEHADQIVTAIETTLTWEAGYDILAKCDGFGGSGFMAKEVLQDYLLWRRAAGGDGLPPLLDELSWTPVGPGARRGLNRLAGRPVRFQQPARKFLAELVEIMPEISGRFWETFGEELTAHDVQFCLCEFDKYERVRLGEGRPRSKYQPPKTER
jgi:hypothetical protein